MSLSISLYTFSTNPLQPIFYSCLLFLNLSHRSPDQHDATSTLYTPDQCNAPLYPPTQHTSSTTKIYQPNLDHNPPPPHFIPSHFPSLPLPAQSELVCISLHLLLTVAVTLHFQNPHDQALNPRAMSHLHNILHQRNRSMISLC